MDKPIIAEYRIEDFHDGRQFSFTKSIVADEVDDFARLSGDYSPLHMNEEFSHGRGFKGRVAHGALLMAYLSRLVGVHFPGKNCLLQSMNIKFLSPVYVNDTVKITATVDQVSMGAGVVVLAVSVENAVTAAVIARGKIQVGFTKPINKDE